MKHFTVIRENLASMGIHPKYCPNSFNKQTVVFVVECLVIAISFLQYFLRVAESTQEYMDVYFAFLIGGCSCISYLNTISIMPKLFDSFEAVENFHFDRE